jgi:hypothetical protein
MSSFAFISATGAAMFSGQLKAVFFTSVLLLHDRINKGKRTNGEQFLNFIIWRFIGVERYGLQYYDFIMCGMCVMCVMCVMGNG